jgi:hypothetical protein
MKEHIQQPMVFHTNIILWMKIRPTGAENSKNED